MNAVAEWVEIFGLPRHRTPDVDPAELLRFGGHMFLMMELKP